MTDHHETIVPSLTTRLRTVGTGHTVGTGVLYYAPELLNQVYLLTAAHVLYEDGDKFTTLYLEIDIDFYNPLDNSYQTVRCPINPSLVNPDTDNDVAVIILDKMIVEAITGRLPQVNCLVKRQFFTGFVVKGFPAATMGKELVTLHPSWKQSMTGANKFQVEMSEQYDEWSMGGFSGSGLFLQVKDEVYLFGTFTRYREEGRGKIIYAQYLRSFNELLFKNFKHELVFSYLGAHGLSRNFFEKHIATAVANLGPRFNEQLNFQLPIAQLFHDLAKDNVFKESLTSILDRWLTAKHFSYHKSEKEVMAGIEAEYAAARNELLNLFEQIGWTPGDIIALESFTKKINELSVKTRDKLYELYDLQSKERELQPPEVKESHSYRPPYQNEISRIREIERNNDFLLDDLDTRNVGLSNFPCVLIQGEAGTGKSHLLGDIATQRTKQGQPTILLLGQLFKECTDVWKQLLEQLQLHCTKDEFLASLNSIGSQTGSRALILIDALNEGAGKQLWPDTLAGFIVELSRYPFIGLALTIRSSYYKAVIPAAVANNEKITHVTHQGFKGNEYEALRLFCEHHGLQQPNFPILAPEFANPLFLQLICEGVKGSNQKVFPQGFQGISVIFNYYLKSIAARLAAKREEYELQPRLVHQAIEEMAKAMFAKEDVKSLTLEEVVSLFKEKFPDYKYLLNDLIHENVFIQSTYTEHESKQGQEHEVIYFAYERFGDFFIAEQLLSPYTTAEEVLAEFREGQSLGKLVTRGYWTHAGLLEAMAVLLPEKFDLEIVEAYSWVFDAGRRNMNDWIGDFLIDSLKWRKTESVNDKKIVEWINSGKLRIDEMTYYNRMLELTTIKNHPFNSDRLTKNMMRHPLPERDATWQQFFRFFASVDDDGYAYPLRRLIDWAWQPGLSAILDTETARLTAQTLTWVLSSTFRRLRDETTKALVNLLEEQPEALLMVLKRFEKIDDPYIAERLYAVAYGCALRTSNKESVAVIARYVYDTIFKEGNPPVHVLLRDYARNIIEFAVHQQIDLGFDMKLVRPPYNSLMPQAFPTEEDMKAYELDHNSEEFKQNHGRLFNFIKFDVMSWDFGDKEIDSALANFTPVSFKVETAYQDLLKTLKKKQRDQVKHWKKLFDLKRLAGSRRANGVTASVLDSMKLTIENCLQEVTASMEKELSPEQYKFLTEDVTAYDDAITDSRHWRRNELNTAPLKRWIVQRAHQLGYNLQLHTSFDNSVDDSNHRTEYKVERIGQKYQWIALHEMMALVADNYKMRTDGDDRKYGYFKGPWQRYVRDVDPCFTTRSKRQASDDDDKEVAGKWWWDNSYKYWHGEEQSWVAKLHDLPDPAQLIQRTDETGTEWLYLRANLTWESEKPIGEDRYDSRRRDIWYLFQGYLIHKKDKKAIINWIKTKDFKGRMLPETHRANLGLFNRENYWSPASQENEKETWNSFSGTRYRLMVATTDAVGELADDKSGAHVRYEMPCKLLFEKMGLKYASTDGDFVDASGHLVSIFTPRGGVLIKKNEVLKFLDEHGLDIVWALLGEKRALGGGWGRDHSNYFTTISGSYHLQDQKVTGTFFKSGDDY